MTDSPATGDNEPAPEPAAFRWPALFQRSSEPLFLLNPQRRILFVNRAWEELTGVAAPEARGRVCKRHARPEPGSWEALARALAPPAEALDGQPARVRRLRAEPEPWWEIDYFPLRSADGVLAILGKVRVLAAESPADRAPLSEELAALRERHVRQFGLDQLTSRLPAMHLVVGQVRLAGQTSVPLLIVGEAGSGKQWLARTIHYHGLTRERPFAALDCARLPAAALDRLLFGVGQLLTRVGTLYLREPAHLPRDLQARLLDWLNADERRQGQAVRLIGGCRTPPADDVRQGRLLDELACALATLTITVPPLRERPADLPDLAARLLARVHDLAPADSRRITELTPEAWKLLRSYPWPGNLRELYAVLAEARAHARGERIDAGDLPAYLRKAVTLGRMTAPSPVRPLPLDQLLEQAEKRLIQLALRLAQGKKSKAAELLQIWRPRLLRRMEALGIKDAEDEKAE